MTSLARQAILKQKIDDYISGMEMSDKFIDYDKLTVDQLLVVQAINDWSGRALVEGGDIKLTFDGDDPCCATFAELSNFIVRLIDSISIVYPVSGFNLSDDDGRLFFKSSSSSYRMMPHVTGSRADAICIAEVKKIQDVEAAMGLWSFCATEDCIAYLDYQLGLYKISIGEDVRVAVRQIVAGFIQANFSIGQIWRAMWGAAKDVAALSVHQYYNVEKAIKTISNNIDHRLTKAIDNPNYLAYERIMQRPLGAVLTLLRHRFGITDSTNGAEVRAKFIADAAINSLAQEVEEIFDGSQEYIRGSIYFLRKFTNLDRLVLSCFKGINAETSEPEWDNSRFVGRINFSLNNLFCFDCLGFLFKLFPIFEVDPPSSETTDNLDLFWNAAEIALVKGGVNSEDAAALRRSLCHVIVPGEVVSVVKKIPIPAGIFAVRIEDVDVSKDGVFNYNEICIDDFTFSIPESSFHPVGDDLKLVGSLANKDFESLANLVSSSIFGSIRCENIERRNRLLALVGHNLLEMASPLKNDINTNA